MMHVGLLFAPSLEFLHDLGLQDLASRLEIRPVRGEGPSSLGKCGLARNIDASTKNAFCKIFIGKNKDLKILNLVKNLDYIDSPFTI